MIHQLHSILQIKNWFHENGLELPELKVETILAGHKSDSSQIMLINEIIFIYKHSGNNLNNLNVHTLYTF